MRRVLASAMGLFLLWSAATWLLEGRMQTLLRPDANLDRAVYALVANLLIGVIGTIVLLGYWGKTAKPGLRSSGFDGALRTLAWSTAGAAVGMAFLYARSPTVNAWVLVNAYAQVFAVSAAEVLVCWSALARAVEWTLEQRGSRWAILPAGLIASAAFGLYHFAHSPPFNTWPMVGFLAVVGLFTSAFFFASRDALATVVFHNFLGSLGVVEALSAAGRLDSFSSPRGPLLLTAGVVLLVLLAGYAYLNPRRAGSTSARHV